MVAPGYRLTGPLAMMALMPLTNSTKGTAGSRLRSRQGVQQQQQGRLNKLLQRVIE